MQALQWRRIRRPHSMETRRRQWRRCPTPSDPVRYRAVVASLHKISVHHDVLVRIQATRDLLGSLLLQAEWSTRASVISAELGQLMGVPLFQQLQEKSRDDGFRSVCFCSSMLCVHNDGSVPVSITMLPSILIISFLHQSALCFICSSLAQLNLIHV